MYVSNPTMHYLRESRGSSHGGQDVPNSSEPKNNGEAHPGITSLSLALLRAGSTALTVHETTEATLIDDVVDSLVSRAQEAGKDESFYVGDLNEAAKLYDLWNSAFPRVQPFYAVKVNNDIGQLNALALLGTGFDCASKDEIERVLSLGVDPGRIVYSHPCKHPSHLIYAAQNGLPLTVIDNQHEVYKMKKLAPSMHLLVRILADDPDAEWKLGNKFGCVMAEAKRLVSLSHKLGLRVVGAHFHVGSGSLSSKAFHDAITKARILFDYAWNACGIKMDLLDIGGGFLGSVQAMDNFPKFAASINVSLDEMFPVASNVRIIAEPGRFFALLPYKLCASVIAKRVTESQEEPPMYYISDGKFGSLTWSPTEGKGSFRVVRLAANHSADFARPETTSSIWGPTCCGTDCVITEIVVPHLEIGDWIVFDDMGAYTASFASLFNGFPRATVVYTAHSSVLARLNNH